MSTAQELLFNTVPQSDYFHFFKKSGELEGHGKKVADFLNYKKEDISVATGVAVNSVRFDPRMTEELKQRLVEWAIAINLVGSHFKDPQKTMLWFQISNPLLGNMSPKDMIRVGRFKKLLKFIQTALDENTR